MSIFDELIKLDETGNIRFTRWIEWRHRSIGLIHCSTCVALDKCWFLDMKKPKHPQHNNCHCYMVQIPTPNCDNTKAECPLDKFTGYIFADKYSWNGKRKLYETLGFTIEDATYLKKEYEHQAQAEYCKGNYQLGKLDSRGQRINIDIKFMRNNRQIVFTSGWMVRAKGLITNNTPLGD